MMSRRTALLLAVAMIVIILWAVLVPNARPPLSEVANESAKVTTSGHAPPKAFSHRRPVPHSLRPLTPAEEELKRLEDEFYREFPLALKFRDYENREGPSAEMEGVSERLKIYMDEPEDVRTKNLRAGSLNVILELEAPLMIKELLVTDSELGQMLRVSFKAPLWDWGHTLRNLDDRIGNSAQGRPTVERVEQLVLALQEREERIVDYCRKKQEEASMPDSIREDIREVTLDLVTRGVAKGYLETITPAELKEARSRVAREAKERTQP